jgi:adenine-specific DNA-methyltransferase
LIAQKLIYFPPCGAADVMLFETRAALSAAIAAGTGPILPKKKTPLLREDLPDIDFWVGKPIATGRPSRKELWTAKPEADRLAPLSSWIAGQNEAVASVEDENGDEPAVLRSDRGGVATEEIKNLLGSKAFPYPKPLSLIQGLLSQATRPNDTILDFFAGSGTTGHAVLALNALDGGNRKFILCSSTEATDKDPAKNLCRDVCAERMKRVIESDTAFANNSFAYLQLDKIAPGDAPFESDCAHAFQLLTLRLGKVARPVPAADRSIQILLQSAAEGSLTVLVHRLTTATLDALAALPLSSNANYGHLRIYSTRPDTVRSHLQQAWEGTEKTFESLSLQKALSHGQIAPRPRRKAKAALENQTL